MRLALLKPKNNVLVQRGLVAEYRMTETEGQTLWNSKKTSLPVQNLVTNGDFALDSNADGIADGWSPAGAGVGSFSLDTGRVAVGSKSQKTTVTSGTKGLINDAGIPLIIGNKYYLSIYASCDLVGATLKLSSVLGSYDFVYGTLNIPNQTSMAKLSRILTATTNVVQMWDANGVGNVWRDGYSIIDLTALFGAGNEPTQAQCDYLFNTWHDGTKVMDLPLYNGQSGSTTGVDTNDPTLDGQGRVYSTDDYDKLPYMINAEQDFTVYLVANVGAVAPGANEYLLSMGNSTLSNQRIAIARLTTGPLIASMYNDSSVGVDCPINLPNIGIRLLRLQRSGNNYSIKDVLSGQIGNAVPPSGFGAFNQIVLGALARLSVSNFSNQPEYFASFHTCATTDAEDQRQLRAVRRELLKRGVTLG